MPTAGETLSQVAPEVAVNEMGEPLVDIVTVCATDGLGGAVNIRVDELKVKVEGGEVTWSVTVTTAGDPTPETVMVTADA
jgi:predicted aspartyl protease